MARGRDAARDVVEVERALELALDDRGCLLEQRAAALDGGGPCHAFGG
jgi:hypothetical protein